MAPARGGADVGLTLTVAVPPALCPRAEFSATFHLTADLFLQQVVSDMDRNRSGRVDLREWLGASPRPVETPPLPPWRTFY